MNNLIYQRYIIWNVVNQRKLRKYVQKIICLIKNVNIINVLN